MTTQRWSDRWRGLLDDASPQTALRVSRGRAYARSGRVTDLRAATGLLTARVQGSRSTPYVVEIGLPAFDDHAWDRVVRVVADQVRHAARLASGTAPLGLETELEREGVRLFPHPAELTTACGCDDPSPWCKHVAAVVEASAGRLDEDPFLLLRLRGRGRERLLADLAAARSGADDDAGSDLADLPWDRWDAARAPLRSEAAAAAAGPHQGTRAAALAGLGDPPGWSGGVDAAGLFGPLVERGAGWASRQREAGAGDPTGA